MSTLGRGSCSHAGRSKRLAARALGRAGRAALPKRVAIAKPGARSTSLAPSLPPRSCSLPQSLSLSLAPSVSPRARGSVSLHLLEAHSVALTSTRTGGLLGRLRSSLPTPLRRPGEAGWESARCNLPLRPGEAPHLLRLRAARPPGSRRCPHLARRGPCLPPAASRPLRLRRPSGSAGPPARRLELLLVPTPKGVGRSPGSAFPGRHPTT